MAVRPQITRTESRGKYNTKGKYAVGICHRSGFKYPLKELKFEPGTNYFVHHTENDGNYSEVTHPQNYLPEKKTERIALRWSFPDTPLSVGTVVSADALFLPMFASVCNQWIQMPDTPTWPSIGVGVSAGSSVGTGVSGNNLDFSRAANSQYLFIVFQGI